MLNISDFPILLVEHEPDQVRRVQAVLSEANLVNPLRVVDSGEKAMAYLTGEDPGAEGQAHPLPALVMLDLALPGGVELLKWIRSQAALKNLPVAVLTSPGERQGFLYQELGASSWLAKPIDAGAFRALLKSMNVYWMFLDRTAGPAPAETGAERKRRVLVADPDVDFLDAIAVALRRRDASIIVETASTLEEAWSLVSREVPDALAYAPQDGKGVEFIARVHAAFPSLPQLFLGDDAQDPATDDAVKAGARRVVIKTTRLDRFADEFHRALIEAWKPQPKPKPPESKPAAAPAATPAPKPARPARVRAGRRQDTDIMGCRIDFQETSWDLVGTARDTGSLDALIRRYWKPLYFYVRQEGYDNETAKDVVQDFLLSALEHDTILKADRTRGRFRTYLLAALGNFLKDRHRSSGRRKRGGGRIPLSLDSEAFQQGHLCVDDSRPGPEASVDRAWARDTLKQCLSQLDGKPSHLQAFELNMNGLEYGKITEETGLREAAAKTAVHRLRRKLRDIIRRHIAAPDSTDEEIDAQIDELSSLLR